MALNVKGPKPNNTEVYGKKSVTSVPSEIRTETLVVFSKGAFIKTFILGLMLRLCNWVTQLFNYSIA